MTRIVMNQLFRLENQLVRTGVVPAVLRALPHPFVVLIGHSDDGEVSTQ